LKHLNHERQQLMHNVRFLAELIDASAFLAPGCVVLGDVTIGAEASIWYHAVIRGDSETIRIGPQSNVQDQCVLHADPGFPCTLGARVTVGHGAIVHGATVEDNVLIGMRAVLMNGAIIGTGSIVGVGAIVTEGVHIPPNSVVLGAPGKVKRATLDRDLDYIRRAAEHYVAASRIYLAAGNEIGKPVGSGT